MAKSLRERAASAFDDQDGEQAEKFLDIILASWQQVSDGITRTVVVIFLLGAVFELLVAAKTTSGVTIGPLSLHNTALLQQFIPALVAYLIYDAYNLVNQFMDLAAIYQELLKRFHKRIYDSGLTFYIMPRIRGPWRAFDSYRPLSSESRRVDNFDSAISIILSIIAFFVLPLAFESQAYYLLVEKYGLGAIFVWISATVTAFFLVAWLVEVAISPQNPGDK